MVMLSDLAFIVHCLGWCHQMIPVDIDAQSMEGQSNKDLKVLSITDAYTEIVSKT